MKMRRNQRFAAAGLYIFLMGGMLCPCNGLFLLLEKSISAPESQPACCSHCAQNAPEPSESRDNQDEAPCGCPSGCCSPYLLPHDGSRTIAQVSVLPFCPVLVLMDKAAVNPVLAETSVLPSESPPRIAPGTLVPGLTCILI